MKNIFSYCGNIVPFDKYINRDLGKIIKSRTIENEDKGSVSVVGMQRMGKSSLVYNTLMEIKEDNVIIKYCTMNLFSDFESFFKNLADDIYNEIEQSNNVNDELKNNYEKVKNEKDIRIIPTRIIRFFKLVKKFCKKIVYIIDEFDHSRKIFKDSIGFNTLRELASQPETNISFVFVSRRLISELENTIGSSTLNNILGTPIYVTCYNKEELERYFIRNKEKADITFDGNARNSFYNITGGQPYWCDLLMKHYCEKISVMDQESNNLNINLNDIFEEISGSIYQEYERLLGLLKEQKLLDKLYQILFGPIFDVTKQDIKKLENYGIIYFNNENKVKSCSENLEFYLQMKESHFDYRSIWNNLENNFRKLLKYKLNRKFGSNWESLVSKMAEEKTDKDKPKNIGNYIYDAINLKGKVQKQRDVYTNIENFSIIEGLTTAGIFEFCSIYYNDFNLCAIFEKGQNDFKKIRIHLQKARNPYQHNNSSFLDQTFIAQTKIYCEQLNRQISDFFSKNNIL